MSRGAPSHEPAHLCSTEIHFSPATTAINGCTWGGSVIHTDLVAGRGLFLEFGNRVVTTRIRQFHLIRSQESSVVH